MGRRVSERAGRYILRRCIRPRVWSVRIAGSHRIIIDIGRLAEQSLHSARRRLPERARDETNTPRIDAFRVRRRVR
jgi:hypothetical protein